jgi:hypothetical protein
MPQLDLITFVDQTVYVYIFFILQYIIISVFVLPGIYQSLTLKRLLYETILKDIHLSLILFTNSLFLLDTSENEFEYKLS